MDKMAAVEEGQLKKSVSKFNVGDTVRVFTKIIEEDRTRIQAFEGIVIRKRGAGMSATLTIRKISYGEGVERIFSLHSPFVEKVVVIKPGKVKRAKLYYLRKKIGKATKVKEAMREEEKS